MKKTVVVIGGGPAGIVTVKSLLEYSTPDLEFDPIILEAEDDIGGTFRYRSYENANLVSSKQMTCFSDFRVPLDHPDHLTLPEYVEYLRDYAKHFGFEDRIKLKCRVMNVSPAPSPNGAEERGHGHIVEYVDNSSSESEPQTRTIHADFVAVCSGLHVTPSWPEIPGIEYVLSPKMRVEGDELPHEVYHSSEYKLRSQLAGRSVMILGTGETGHDLAYEAAKAGATQVTLCTRGGFLSFPKVLNDFEVFGYKFEGNLPIDGLITNLFETTYVHPWVAYLHVRWFVSDFVLRKVLWFLTGTEAGCNQWVGELDGDRLGRAYVFLNKSNKAMPYINRSWRTRPWYLDYMSRYIDPPEDMPPHTDFSVELAPFPSYFDPTGKAIFPLTKRKESKRIQEMEIRPQTVVYATGYTQTFDFLDPVYDTPNGKGVMSAAATPTEDIKSLAESGLDVRDILSSADPTIAYIGFVRPGVGAIPPIAEMQALFWTGIITGRVKMASPMKKRGNGMTDEREEYHLLQSRGARIRYGVDHGAYQSTLARDMGAMPGLFDLWWKYGTHVLISYIMGAAFTPYYRLTGPFVARSAPQTVTTELWDTITRRGILGNLAMGIVPMIFYGLITGLITLLELLWLALGRPSWMGLWFGRWKRLGDMPPGLFSS
ncbi:FAD/NAD(P)-binding domain-containing protein [Clavulina sp. PMI_390]|nr:FAD/NAD(P)-binding domain-containing protein [Clavulina sp. PMI_390]